MEQAKCSETLAFKLQTPRNNPEESIRHPKHGESLKSRSAPLIRINWDDEPSGYAENPDNWIFLCK
jgi:hypothetical protein